MNFEECHRHYFFGKSGKRLLVKEWGPHHKPAILLVHGFPGCADHGKFMSGSPYWEQFRLIAVDRPGYGSSDPQVDITPLGFAEQIETLLHHLSIERLSLLSVSGGAPYSLAVAHRLPHKIDKITSIGGVAPLNPLNFFFMNSRQKKTWLLGKTVPDKLLHTVVNFRWQNSMEKMERFFFTETEAFSPADRQVLFDAHLGPQLLKSMKTAIEKGPTGVLADMRVYSKPWGFSLKEIKCPVTLWHGLHDDVVNFRFAQDLSYRLPNAKRRFIKNEGHYSILLNQRDEILKDLLEIK
jgi:pimeloyl-ACP methyl ester carboxylesterase